MANSDEIKAGGAAIEFTADTSKADKEVSGFLEQLKKNFGRGSVFKESVELFAGAGIAKSISEAAERVDELTKKAVELKEAFGSGAKGAGEIAEELIKAVPIVGHLFDAGRNIRELFTGEAAQLKEAADALAQHQGIANTAATAFHGDADAKRESDDYTRDLERQRVRTSDGPAGKAVHDILDRLREGLEKSDKFYADHVAEVVKKNQYTDPTNKDKGPVDPRELRQSLLDQIRDEQQAIRDHTGTAPMFSTKTPTDIHLENIESLKKRLEDITPFVDRMNEALGHLYGQHLDQFIENFRIAGAAFRELHVPETLLSGLKAFGMEMEELAKRNQKAVAEIKAHNKMIEDAFGKAELDKVLASADSIREQIKTPIEKADDEAAKAKKALDDDAINHDEYQKRIDLIGQSIRDQVATPAGRAQKEASVVKDYHDHGYIDDSTYQKRIEQIAKGFQDSVHHFSTEILGSTNSAAISRGYLGGQSGSTDLSGTADAINQNLEWIVQQIQNGTLTMTYSQ